MKQSIRRFDKAMISMTNRIPDSFRPIMLFATLLGQPPITVGSSAAIIGYGIARQDTGFIVGGSIAIITFIISSLMKVFLRRERPINDYVKNMFMQTYSFPSGHAAGSVASFGLLGILLLPYYPLGIIACVLIACICFVIGISRIYLGAHYPSDVIGGWITGIAGLAIIAAVEVAA